MRTGSLGAAEAPLVDDGTLSWLIPLPDVELDGQAQEFADAPMPALLLDCALPFGEPLSEEADALTEGFALAEPDTLAPVEGHEQLLAVAPLPDTLALPLALVEGLAVLLEALGAVEAPVFADGAFGTLGVDAPVLEDGLDAVPWLMVEEFGVTCVPTVGLTEVCA
jgi:hypothetical protein